MSFSDEEEPKTPGSLEEVLAETQKRLRTQKTREKENIEGGSTSSRFPGSLNLYPSPLINFNSLSPKSNMDDNRNTNNNPNQNPYMLNEMLANPQMQILLTQMLQGLQNQQNQTREKTLGEYMTPVIGESPFKIVLPQVPGFKLTHNLLNHLPRFDGKTNRKR